MKHKRYMMELAWETVVPRTKSISFPCWFLAKPARGPACQTSPTPTVGGRHDANALPNVEMPERKKWEWNEVVCELGQLDHVLNGRFVHGKMLQTVTR